jgi:hypothetical protein
MPSRIRLGWAFAAVALVVSLAGCVSMQDSGPPGTVQVSPSSSSQDAANIGPIPASPGPNLSPKQIVEAFLQVSASYSTYPGIVTSYLTQQEAAVWNPDWSATVFSAPPDITPQQPTEQGRSAPKKEIVTVQGQVQATFSGSGQYLSAEQSSTHSSCAAEQPNTCEQFTLTQENGQWRIAQLPPHLLLDSSDFLRVYQPQDLYFFDPGYKVLVPETVFVPLGTSEQQTLTTLVCTLIPPGEGVSGSAPGCGSGSPSQTWLTAGATVTSIPAGTTMLSPVSYLDGTATVNLGGAIANDQKAISLVMAQLTGTLIAGPVTAVDLEINGDAWGTTQTANSYTQYSPYPANQGVFTYVDNGVALSRCGASSEIASASMPVFGATGTPALTSCGGASATPSASPSSTQHATGKGHTPAAKPLTMAAATPDGDYLAGVSSAGDMVTIWNLKDRDAEPVKWSEQGQKIGSISWDRRDDLWVVVHNSSNTSSSIYVVSPAGTATLASFSGGTVVSLSVAPDGVRAALIVQTGSGSGAQQQVELAGIVRAACGSSCREPGSVAAYTLSQGPPLGGASITDAVSLAWYDKDDLAVLDNSEPASDLWEVPVSGRPPLGPYQVSAGSSATASSGYADSIAAYGAGNVMVVGMDDGQLLYSAAFGQQWQGLGSGTAPAYSANP